MDIKKGRRSTNIDDRRWRKDGVETVWARGARRAENVMRRRRGEEEYAAHWPGIEHGNPNTYRTARTTREAANRAVAGKLSREFFGTERPKKKGPRRGGIFR